MKLLQGTEERKNTEKRRINIRQRGRNYLNRTREPDKEINEKEGGRRGWSQE